MLGSELPRRTVHPRPGALVSAAGGSLQGGPGRPQPPDHVPVRRCPPILCAGLPPFWLAESSRGDGVPFLRFTSGGGGHSPSPPGLPSPTEASRPGLGRPGRSPVPGTWGWPTSTCASWEAKPPLLPPASAQTRPRPGPQPDGSPGRGSGRCAWGTTPGLQTRRSREIRHACCFRPLAGGPWSQQPREMGAAGTAVLAAPHLCAGGTWRIQPRWLRPRSETCCWGGGGGGFLCHFHSVHRLDASSQKPVTLGTKKNKGGRDGREAVALLPRLTEPLGLVQPWPEPSCRAASGLSFSLGPASGGLQHGQGPWPPLPTHTHHPRRGRDGAPRFPSPGGARTAQPRSQSPVPLEAGEGPGQPPGRPPLCSPAPGQRPWHLGASWLSAPSSGSPICPAVRRGEALRPSQGTVSVSP